MTTDTVYNRQWRYCINALLSGKSTTDWIARKFESGKFGDIIKLPIECVASDIDTKTLYKFAQSLEKTGNASASGTIYAAVMERDDIDTLTRLECENKVNVGIRM